MVWIHHAGVLGVRARSAVIGEEKSFREMNPFVLGKGEKKADFSKKFCLGKSCN